MSDTNTLEYARQLFEEEKYKECSEISVELAKFPEQTKEALILFVKAFLHRMDFKDKQQQEILSTALNKISYCVNTLDEVHAIIHEIFYELEKIMLRDQKNALEKLLHNPTFRAWENFLNLFMNDIIMRASIMSYIRRDEFGEREGFTKEEITERLHSSKPEYPPVGDCKKEVEDTLNKILSATKNKFEENKDASLEYVSALGEKTLNRLALCKLMVDYIIPKEDEGNSKARLGQLKKKAELLEYGLNAVSCPNGIPLSLLQGSSRSDEIKKLSEVYAEIKKLDPEFEHPPFPDPNGYTAPKPASTYTSTASSSGGCYVATAVYGSYDCPEVWTLRRYRDNTLASTWYGRVFIKTYYAISPTLVKWFGEADWFKSMWKPKLDKMVKSLNKKGVKDTPYKD